MMATTIAPAAWRLTVHAAALAMALGLCASAALAIQPGGDAAEARTEAGRDRARTAPASGSSARGGPAAPEAGLALVRGTVDAVDPAKGQLTVGGRVLPLHPSALRVVGASGLRLSGADALRPGMRLRFAREPALQAAPPAATDDTARRVVLIYIEPSP